MLSFGFLARTNLVDICRAQTGLGGQNKHWGDASVMTQCPLWHHKGLFSISISKFSSIRASKKKKKIEPSTLLESLSTGWHKFSNHIRPGHYKTNLRSNRQSYIVYVECWVVASLTLVLLPTRAFGADPSDQILLRVTRAEGLPNHRHGAR